MTHQIIEKIEQKMRAHLNVEQQNILHNALLQCLSEEIVQSGESGTENFVKIFLAAKISSTGSAVSVTRMVSPMPIHSSPPMPMADLIMPMEGVPASVTPRCRG